MTPPRLPTDRQPTGCDTPQRRRPTAMSTVPVRIRHDDTADSVPLCDWPLADLDGLIRLVKSWGTYLPDLSTEVSSDADFTGQFVVGEAGAYFEIVIDTSDAS